MPAACATSSTLTSAKPRAANSPRATSVMCWGVVERRRPTRLPGNMAPPFRSGTRCHILTKIVTGLTPACRAPDDERQPNGADAEERGRHRTRHRDPGGRGVHRRHVRGLLTVSSPVAGFNPDAAWRLHPQVAVRPEPFGALLYHFGTRKLSFLKNRTILGLVQSLADHPDARAACRAAGIDDAEQRPY